MTETPPLLDRARSAFPRSIASEVAVAVARMPPADFVHTDAEPVWVDGEQLWLPGRLYNPPCPLGGDDTSATVLRCLYTRHHDGFVRQRAVEAELDSALRPWTVPYVVRLVGEYVVEIVEAIGERLNLGDASVTASYGRFVQENPEFMALTRQRATSYWAAYYRGRYPVLKPAPADHWTRYPALSLLDDLDRIGRE